MPQQEPRHGAPIGPLDWWKLLPFAPAATSDRLGWAGLQAVRYRAAPSSELQPPAMTHHRLILFARPPKELDLLYEGVKRHVPPPEWSIAVVPAGNPAHYRWGGSMDTLNIYLEPGLVDQVATYIIYAGGKRLRPLLVLLAARACGHKGEQHIDAAAIIEFIHTATLLHDDVVDASDLRRGRDTANALWGNKPAILVGDFLFSRSFELMVADGSLRILEILSRASSIIAEGEVLQLRTQNDLETTETAYLEVIEAKTAELFAAASRIGAVLAARPSEEEAALDRFGRSLGIAFQLVDDMLDFSARQTEFGKSIGDDFREGKVTLPILLAFARGDEAERIFWRRALEEMDQRPGDLDHAIELIERRGAFVETLLRARGYAATAIDALSIFHDGVERRALVEAAAFATERSS